MKAKGGKMGNKVVALVLMVFAVAIRSQDLAALLAQGQAGGLNLAQVPWDILTLQWMRKINLMDLMVLLLILKTHRILTGILKVVGALQQRGMLDQVTNLCLHCRLFWSSLETFSFGPFLSLL